MIQTYYIGSTQDMISLGAKLAQDHTHRCLYGKLGSGKTTLVQGLGKHLGCDQKLVKSPTYTYSQTYNNILLHIDMYRMQTWEQCLMYGIYDQIITYPYVAIERPKFKEHYDDLPWIHIYIQDIDTKKHMRTVIVTDQEHQI